VATEAHRIAVVANRLVTEIHAILNQLTKTDPQAGVRESLRLRRQEWPDGLSTHWLSRTQVRHLYKDHEDEIADRLNDTMRKARQDAATVAEHAAVIGAPQELQRMATDRRPGRDEAPHEG
jgi:hypothetical protein